MSKYLIGFVSYIFISVCLPYIVSGFCLNELGRKETVYKMRHDQQKEVDSLEFNICSMVVLHFLVLYALWYLVLFINGFLGFVFVYYPVTCS